MSGLFVTSAPAPLPSPHQTLLSLPGADTDEDLLPPPLLISRHHPLLHIRLLRFFSSLMIPAMSLPPSPSPEDFNINLNIVLDDESDPELTKLYNLHKKSPTAEHAAQRLS
jgi:hypothetical protein